MKKTFRISALLLVFILLASFTDVPNVKGERWDWAYPYVSNAAERGLMIGDGDGYFRPGDYTSKEESAIIIYRIINYGTSNMTPAARDLTADETALLDRCQISSWARLYLIDGFTQGYWSEEDFAERSDDKPAGKQPLSRQKIAEWLVKAKAIQTSSLSILSFTDSSSVNTALSKYVDACYRTGLMIGDDQGKFNPLNGVNRAEMAVVLTRALNLTADTSEAASKSEINGKIVSASGNSFVMSSGGSSRTVYIEPSAAILLDGAAADIAAVDALAGKTVTMSTVIGSNVVIVQTKPKVFTGTVESVTDRGSYSIVNINIGGVTASFIKDPETNCSADLSGGTSIKFISDGSNLLEIN